MSRTLLPFNFTLVGLTAALSTGVATINSLAQLGVQDTEEWRQCRCGDARLTENSNAKSKQLLMLPTEQLTDWEWLPESPWVDGNVQRPGCFFFFRMWNTYSPSWDYMQECVPQTHNEWEQNIPSIATDVHITIHAGQCHRGGWICGSLISGSGQRVSAIFVTLRRSRMNWRSQSTPWGCHMLCLENLLRWLLQPRVHCTVSSSMLSLIRTSMQFLTWFKVSLVM